MSITLNQWQRARTSVPEVLERLLTLLDGAPPDLPATAHWTIADTVAHLATIAATDVALVRGPAGDPSPSVVRELRLNTTVDTVAAMNRIVMSKYTERSLSVLAGRLRADVAELLAATEDADPLREIIWLGGANLPIAGLFAHLVNELNIHAWDIARALRRPWYTDPRDAAMFVDLFLVGVTRCGYGKLLDHDRPVRPGRISVTFRAGVSEPVTMALVDGRVVLEELDPRPDVRVSYDPVVFNLMLFGRVSKARAALTGRVRVAGRRPWLLPEFMATMRLPS
ncbi:maleylpyruvate isomerase N-terminal domain-containing protein [Longispora urticae]